MRLRVLVAAFVVLALGASVAQAQADPPTAVTITPYSHDGFGYIQVDTPAPNGTKYNWFTRVTTGGVWGDWENRGDIYASGGAAGTFMFTGGPPEGEQMQGAVREEYDVGGTPTFTGYYVSNVVDFEWPPLSDPYGGFVVDESQASIEIWWTNDNTSHDGFEIEYREGVGAWVSAGTSTDPMKTVEGLTPGTAYEFRVRAYRDDDMSTSNWLEGITGETDEEVLNPPDDLLAEEETAGDVTLTWTDTSDNETGFEIWHRLGSSGEFELLHTTGANVVEWVHEGLEKGSVHSYRIRSINATLQSEYEPSGTAVSITLEDDFFRDGGEGFAGHVSGAVNIHDEECKILTIGVVQMGSDGGTSSPSGTGGINPQPIGYYTSAGLRSCGSRTAYIQCLYVPHDTITPGDPNGTQVSTTWKVVVGRNGMISVNGAWGQTTVAGGAEGNFRALTSRMLQFLLDNWEDKATYYTEAPPQWINEPLNFGSYRKPGLWHAVTGGDSTLTSDYWDGPQHAALNAGVKSFIQNLYDSMTGTAVTWSSIIPRCPGQDLGAEESGSGGALPSGSYARSTSDSVLNDKFDEPEQIERLRVLPTVDFEQEVSSVYSIDGTNWFPGWSTGDATWSIDLRNLAGTGAAGEAFNLMCAAFRSMLIGFCVLTSVFVSITALRQA
jgi:hypothetical protein